MKKSFKIFSIQYHKPFAYFCGIFLFLFVLSGALHPIMSWTGPRPVQFTPKVEKFSEQDVLGLQNVIQNFSSPEVTAVQLVPSERGPLVQMTEKQLAPKMYFQPDTGEMIHDYDQQQAIWLAEYYTGLRKEDVQSIELQTAFDHEYPSVNRLLPVYKILFNTPDQRLVYINTELGVLASISNDWKTSLKKIFQWFHSWKIFGEGFESYVFISAFLAIGAVCLLLLSGIGMIFFLKRKKASSAQKQHRLFALVCFIPLTAWVISGFYHLIHNQMSPNRTAYLEAQASIQLPLKEFKRSQETSEALASGLSDRYFSKVAFVQGDDATYLRMSEAPKPNPEASRTAVYAGLAQEKKSFYYNTQTDQWTEKDDEKFARFLIQEHLDVEPSDIVQVEKVTRFGKGYDFRNKRLPVWKVELRDHAYQYAFVDNNSGMLVDKVTQAQVIEGFVFSNLHKWNWLTPYTGRFIRDVIMFVFLMGLLYLSYLGLIGLLNSKKITIPNKRFQLT